VDKKIAFMDLRIKSESDRNELLAAIDGVFQHGRFIMGPEVEELEREIAALSGKKYGVGLNSGTTALFLALKSLGVTQGDEVITSPLSWIATSNAIALTGATCVFADIKDDLNIDPVSVKSMISPKTKAIVPVHYTGKVCDMAALMDMANEYKVGIVEDACQSFYAQYNGRQAGSFGILGCFSMNPMKVFAGCGEAGLIVTDSKELYERLIILRYNGMINRQECIETSLNGRIDTIQAAILLKRLKKVDGIVQKRRENAFRYDKQLKDVLTIPKEEEAQRDTYYTYTIRTNLRDELKDYLTQRGIETQIQHTHLMPDQPAYRNRVKGDFPNARRLARQVLCIPVNENLSFDDIDHVSGCIREFYRIQKPALA